jgi:hypothetical protein
VLGPQPRRPLAVGGTVSVDGFGEEKTEPRGGPPGIATQSDHVTGARTRPGNGGSTLEIPERGDREREGIGDRHVSPHHTTAGRELATRVAESDGDLFEHRDRSVSSSGDRHYQGGGACAHGRDVGEVGCCSLPAEIVSRRPRKPKVRTVHHHVGRHDKPTVRCRDHRSVIARPQQSC